MSYKKIRKAVFPAAGLGTRFLPATKSIPKEMLCLVDKPLIQYGVEEAVAAGCTEIIIVTGRDKGAMEDHFDSAPELEASLRAKNKQDDIVDAQVPCMKQMVEAFEETQASILASEVVEGPAISAYGCLDSEPVEGNPKLLAVKGMVEKPKFEEAPSPNAIIGRYILTPRIFEMLETITPGVGGELQLTDAIKALLNHEKVYGFHYEGKRHDAGDKLGFLKATVELALKRDDLGPGFKEWLKNFPI
jgi:UTP--glucose-1-phosphate uridylyltransferase